MITGKENILKWFDASGKKFWFIYPYGKSDSATYTNHSTITDDNISTERTRQELADALTYMRGRYTIAVTTENKRSPRSDWKEDFEIGSEASQAPQMQAINGISPDELTQRINDALYKYKTDEELKALKAENAQLKKDFAAAEKEANEPINKIAGIAMQYLPMIMGGMQPQQPTAQVAGLTHDPHEEKLDEIILSEEENHRLSKVIDVFEKVAGNEWLSLLERMAAKLETNPELLGTLKMIL